jgi:hypothetical protein
LKTPLCITKARAQAKQNLIPFHSAVINYFFIFN